MGLAVEFSTITEMFENLTRVFANKTRPALMYKSGQSYRGITFSQLKSDVEIFALGLAALGVQRGDRVALISENRPEWIVSDMAILSLGAVNVPMYMTLTPKQIQFILDDAQVRFLIVSNQLQLDKVLSIVGELKCLERLIVIHQRKEQNKSNIVSYASLMEMGKKFRMQQEDFLKRERSKNRPADLLTIIYTSGTTGQPKGVMLTHGNLVSNIHAATECIPITSDDVLLTFLPFCHSFERMAGYYTAMSCGGTIAFAESIEKVNENLVEVQPTFVTGVPRFFERMSSRLHKRINSQSPLRKKIFHWAVDVGKAHAQGSKVGLPSALLNLKHRIADRLVFRKIKERLGGRVKFFVSGGAALPRELGEFFEALGILIIEGYGMTEASPVISVNRVESYKFGTVGFPIPGIEVRIADDGEILVRGPNVMKGYWNNARATAEEIDEGGWLHTGDIGMFDKDGFLSITDRKKHIFVSSGGKNIAPQPIENLLLQSEYIDQVVLIGEKRMFCSALIVPYYDAVREYGREHGFRYTNNEKLACSEEIRLLFQQEIDRLQKDLAHFERVRKFTLLGEPLTIEEGELTPTLKIRRSVIEKKFAPLIEKMYEGTS